MSMSRSFAVVSASLILSGAALAADPDLELIMSDPDWIGNAPQSAWWSDDGSAVYYTRKRDGEDFSDRYRVGAGGGDSARLAPGASNSDSGASKHYDRDRTCVAWVDAGDIYLKQLDSGSVTRVTHTTARESAPVFLADGSGLAFQRDDQYWLFEFATGTQHQLADLQFKEDPDAISSFSALREQQARIYTTAVEDRRRKLAASAAAEAQRDGGQPYSLSTVYLGSDVALERQWLSPDGHHLLLAVYDKARGKARDKGDVMPNYVTLDGPVATRDVRERVGRQRPNAVRLWLLDLKTGERTDIDTADLPGRDRDPLRKLRKSAIDWHVNGGADRAQVETALKAPELRELVNPGARWNPNGTQVAVMLYAGDNKDRWLVTVTPGSTEPRLQHRETDEAWINWAYQDFGWIGNTGMLWYQSEATGYNHLYAKAPESRRAQALTGGEFVVREPEFNPTGDTAYVVANRNHPGEYEVFRVPLAGGELEQLTDLRGVTQFSLSPSADRLLLSHSAMDRHADLHVVSSAGGTPLRLTDTVSDAFKAIDWSVPEIVEVPSSHTPRPIYSKLYLPQDHEAGQRYPAVMFVHGAGYTQNAHKGWPYYFREFMFHTLLNRAGYVVLDMDYRASEGYGRDWRTAIYRNMGHPELEDYLDGIEFLVDRYGVDRSRIGIYGGSYGGFMTFMALFRAPEAFAAGAALRPVVDWMHYNHGYTSAILNTPDVDPEAYQKSSPINHAEGLTKPLLIAVGMQDNNVFFQDSVLLVQRLLELKKEDYEIALYPLDAHSFVHPESWLDEYRRIFKLMEQNVKGAGTPFSATR